VADSGGGDARERISDLAALPPELSRQSLSRGMIILPLDAALQAIAHLTRDGWRIENWEGWVRMRDGGRAKSLAHAGSFSLPQDPARAADVAAAGMKRADERWRRDPEYPGAQLCYGLNFRAV
jgi:hypothetical protein